jgi:hypothetical protein
MWYELVVHVSARRLDVRADAGGLSSNHAVKGRARWIGPHQCAMSAMENATRPSVVGRTETVKAKYDLILAATSNLG